MHLLPEWLAHHVALVGDASHVHVIDHASQNPKVVRLLELFKLMGGHVVHFKGPFPAKHIILTNTMRAVAKSSRHNDTLLLPLDADEFLFAGQLDTSHAAIAERLASIVPVLAADGFKAKLRTAVARRCMPDLDQEPRRVFGAVHFLPLGRFNPHHPIRNCLAKTMFLASTFVSIDQGAHFGLTTQDRKCHPNTSAYSAICRACFHSIDLGVSHYGTSALTEAEYEQKLERRAAAYGVVGGRCGSHPSGVRYCNFMRSFFRDRNAFLSMHRNNTAAGCARSMLNLGLAAAINQSSFYNTFLKV